MLSLILNMAIAELVLLITKVLEAIRGIHSRQQRENAHEDKNKAQKQVNGILTADVLPLEPVMIPEAAVYPKLKKIKTELDSQNACRKPDTPTHKDEKLSDKLARLQREAAENQNSISRQTKDRGGR